MVRRNVFVLVLLAIFLYHLYPEAATGIAIVGNIIAFVLWRPLKREFDNYERSKGKKRTSFPDFMEFDARIEKMDLLAYITIFSLFTIFALLDQFKVTFPIIGNFIMDSIKEEENIKWILVVVSVSFVSLYSSRAYSNTRKWPC